MSPLGIIEIQLNLNSSNNDGFFTMADTSDSSQKISIKGISFFILSWNCILWGISNEYTQHTIIV